jgi:uncharacterized protein
MRFWDSSAIVPLTIAEPSTEALQAAAAQDPVMRVWWATEIECVSALARLERDGELTDSATTAALERLDVLTKPGTRCSQSQRCEASRAASFACTPCAPLTPSSLLQP